MMDEYVSRRELFMALASLRLPYEEDEKVRALIERAKKVNLLERDQGKEPILEEGSSLIHESRADGTGGFVERPFLDWKCPICGWFVGELYCGHGKWHIQGEKSYCARCGQKIDWATVKEEEKKRYEETKAAEREAFQKKNGIPLDNMNERQRRKYGMLKKMPNIKD